MTLLLEKETMRMCDSSFGCVSIVMAGQLQRTVKGDMLYKTWPGINSVCGEAWSVAVEHVCQAVMASTMLCFRAVVSKHPVARPGQVTSGQPIMIPHFVGRPHLYIPRWLGSRG